MAGANSFEWLSDIEEAGKVAGDQDKFVLIDSSRRPETAAKRWVP